MDIKEIEDKVIVILTKYAHGTLEKIDNEEDLNNIGIYSWEFVKVVIDFENEFNIDFEDEFLRMNLFANVHDVSLYINKRIQAQKLKSYDLHN